MSALPSSLSSPPFGQADLTNCEREQIQFTGSIQPHGAALIVDETTGRIIHASANARAFLGLSQFVGTKRLEEWARDLTNRLRTYCGNSFETLDRIPAAIRCSVGEPPIAFDALAHRPSTGGLMIELERAGPSVDLSRHLGDALQKILECTSLRALGDDVSQIFKDLAGYDRVMFYRFDEQGHGEVFSERREPNLEPYVGNRYPASDIPQIARRLYQRNRVRVLVDVTYQPVPVEPRETLTTGGEIDFSLSFLRSMSPIHLQYLKNMGVGATLVASIMVGGKLWGLIACHHYAPRFVHYEIRAVCELLAEAVGTRIAALESFVQTEAELAVRRLEQRMAETIARDGDWRVALFDSAQSLLQPFDASGAALIFEGQTMTVGEVPGTAELRDIAQWLSTRTRETVVGTASLTLDEPRFRSLVGVASGVLATRVSDTPGEYLIWFRPEQVKRVTWGGDPSKPFVAGNDPMELSPRRSFAQWHQVVEATSDPWRPADLRTARLIGESVTDIVLQFRSVRMLIALDQFNEIGQQVRQSSQPVIIANAAGKVLLTNESFEQLLQAGHPDFQWLEDLPLFFDDPGEARRHLRGLLRQEQPWRGEVVLETGLARTKPLLVRGDPIFASPGRLLGFVILFTDLSERKIADSARREFHQGIVAGQRFRYGHLDSKADLVYRELMSAVVENAQLAALEISDGVDLAEMPAMLESLRLSVGRTAELLELLVRHASRSKGV